MSDTTISFAVLGAVVALFVWNVVAPEIVAVGAALALYAAGVLDAHQVFAGFGDATVVFITALFVVSEGLDATGVTTWAGQQMIARARSSSGLLVLNMVLFAVVAAVITPTGAVAALVPVAVVIAMKIGRSPSSLLMPLAFVASAGSMLALTGSPVNVIVSEAAAQSGGDGFGYLTFAPVGVPLVVGSIAIVALLGRRLVPERNARTIPPDLSVHAHTLLDHYAIERPNVDDDELFTREEGVAEVVIPPRSPLVGADVFPGMVTTSGDLVVVAVQRRGADLDGEAVLAIGDTLLLRGTWGALDRNLEASEVLVVDPPELVRRQAVPMGPGAKRAIAVLIAMVVLLATGVVPAFVASVLAACAMVVLRVLSVDDAYRAVSWTTVVLIGAMIAVSTAIKDSGAAEKMANGLVQTVGDAGPHALLAGLFVLTAVFGQLISNTATALIVVPIAVSAAGDIGVSPRPVLMSVAVAAAASFLTPVATPANMMVMGPGGYRFADYWKLGSCMLVLFFVVATLLVPVVWSF
jgi:di/tricarboxylate transporter